ncbi:SsgA family sporulation/cell division regulator [Streptomyces pseudoechinosporeus]
MPQSLPFSVVHAVTVYVGVTDELPVPLPAELHYDSTDPYAVLLSLGAPETSPVDWVFARTLLMEGLRRPTGTGDVLVIPRHRYRPRAVHIVLRSARGAALIEIAAAEVSAFLEQTVALVPPGTETLLVDLDRALAELTDSSD